MSILSLPQLNPSYVTEYQEIARVPINFTANGFTVTLPIPLRNFLHILIRYRFISGTPGSPCYIRFNGDSGGNYATSTSLNGNADAAATLGSGIVFPFPVNTTTINTFIDLWINNVIYGGMHRVMHSHEDQSQGSGTAPNRTERSGTWASTAQINSISLVFAAGNTFAIEGEILVLGTDYWQ